MGRVRNIGFKKNCLPHDSIRVTIPPHGSDGQQYGLVSVVGNYIYIHIFAMLNW